jgi:tripartite-type tricarboxylate transporter receptor subunit TctC
VEKLNREINAALADPRIKAKFDDLGCVSIGNTPEAFGALIVDETEKWGRVVKFAGLRAD